jgi:hypothetical protein
VPKEGVFLAKFKFKQHEKIGANSFQRTIVLFLKLHKCKPTNSKKRQVSTSKTLHIGLLVAINFKNLASFRQLFEINQ